MLVTHTPPRRGIVVPRRFAVPPFWRPRRVRRHRPWCPQHPLRVRLRMMGTPSSNGSAPLAHPDGGPMAGCCCPTDFCDATSGSLCTDCLGHMPEGYTVVVSGVTVCTDCMNETGGIQQSHRVIDATASLAVNGTRCFVRSGASENPCPFTSHSATPDTWQDCNASGVFPNDPPCTTCDPPQTGYLRTLNVDVAGGQTTFNLEIAIGGGGAGPRVVFSGSTTVTPPDPAAPCYATATITNTRTMCCVCATVVAGGGGSATVAPCC